MDLRSRPVNRANNELETYTDSRRNSYLDGQGHLVIKALRNGNGYTSARLLTQGLLYQKPTAN